MNLSGIQGKSFQNLRVEIGERLTEFRKKKGYTSYESFALDFDLPRVQYWRLEKGKANFTLATLAKILGIHNITLEEFFFTLRIKHRAARAK
jgi:transcriptional regulator with XRE-family HTH domain